MCPWIGLCLAAGDRELSRRRVLVPFKMSFLKDDDTTYISGKVAMGTPVLFISSAVGTVPCCAVEG